MIGTVTIFRIAEGFGFVMSNNGEMRSAKFAVTDIVSDPAKIEPGCTVRYTEVRELGSHALRAANVQRI
jgi:hypothetical protein